jgi:predicted nucleotidyltransferase
MQREDVIARLKEHEAESRRLGLAHLYLFGSTARDEAQDDLAVDLLFEHPEGSFGLLKLMAVKEFAADILGCRSDIMTHPTCVLELRHVACSFDGRSYSRGEPAARVAVEGSR